jgi:hypothetical protein
MGYSYGRTRTGRHGLACDKCGTVGNVRKRACRFRVSDEGGITLPWCPAPALCNPCFTQLGGSAGLHGDACRDGAAVAQADYDRTAERLAAGDKHVRVAYGDWHAQVPTGSVLVGFTGSDRVMVYRLMPKGAYKGCGFLSDYVDSIPADGNGEPLAIVLA